MLLAVQPTAKSVEIIGLFITHFESDLDKSPTTKKGNLNENKWDVPVDTVSICLSAWFRHEMRKIAPIEKASEGR